MQYILLFKTFYHCQVQWTTLNFSWYPCKNGTLWQKKATYIKCAKILRSITGAADIYPAKCEKGDFEESWLSIDLVSPKPFLDWGLVSLLSSLGFMITLANIAIKSLKFLGWKKDGSST